MSEYTKEELEDLQKTLYRLKDLMKEMKKGDVIDFKAAKAKKESKKDDKKAHKMSDHIGSRQTPDSEDRLHRIRSSMEKINTLMSELKRMSNTEKDDSTKKDEMSDQHKAKIKDHIAQLTRMRDHLVNINDHMSDLKDKAGLGKDKKTDK